MAVVWRETSNLGTKVATPPRREGAYDLEIAELAENQHGRVALHQLTELGLSASAVRSRVVSGRLRRVHRGVYAVGHRVPGARGQWMAAVLACSTGAVLSHRSAGGLIGLRADNRTITDVTAPGRVGRGHSGIRAHSAAGLTDADVTVVEGIPCTTVARTLLDLAGELDRRGLERAFDQAELLRILDVRAVATVLERAAGRHGTSRLAALLSEVREPARTRSAFEETFLGLCRERGLAHPLVNQAIVVGGGRSLTVDFVWPQSRLAVEADSYEFHRTRAAFERDRECDRLLTLAGWRPQRFTSRQVERQPAGVAAAVRQLLI